MNPLFPTAQTKIEWQNNSTEQSSKRPTRSALTRACQNCSGHFRARQQSTYGTIPMSETLQEESPPRRHGLEPGQHCITSTSLAAQYMYTNTELQRTSFKNEHGKGSLWDTQNRQGSGRSGTQLESKSSLPYLYNLTKKGTLRRL